VEITPPQKDGGNLSGWSAIGGCATEDPPPSNGSEPYGRRGLYCTVQIVSDDGDDLVPFGDGSNTLVLISCDLHSCTQPLHKAVTSHLSSQYSIPSSNVILNGTHTHSGPGRFYGNKLYDAMTVSTHNLLFGFDSAIFNRLVGKIQGCVDEAISKLSMGTFAVTQTKLYGYSSNRSLSAHKNDPEYSSWTTSPESPSFGAPSSPLLTSEDVHIDPRLNSFITTSNDTESVSGVIGTFSCHGTSMGPQTRFYDPDWFGSAKVAFNASHPSPDIPVAIMQACCGDICPSPICGPLGELNERGPRPANFGEALKDTVGKGVGEALAGMVKEFTSSSDTPLAPPRGRSKRKKATTTTATTTSLSSSSSLTIQSATHLWLPADDFAPSNILPSTIPSSSLSLLSPANFGVVTIAGTASGGNAFLYKRIGMGYPSNTLPSSHPQHPKTPLPFPASFYISRAAPDALPLTVLVINQTLAIATVPGEPTITAGFRIEKAIKEETGATNCIVLGFCGDYAGYWVTEEEYDEQLYEGSSMIFGKFGLSVLTKRLRMLAKEALESAPSKKEMLARQTGK